MNKHFVILAALLFTLFFVTSCKDKEPEKKALVLEDSSEFVQAPIIQPAIIEEENDVVEFNETVTRVYRRALNPSNVEGPYPEKGFNASMGLGGNIGGGGGPGGSSGGFRYRKAKSENSSEHYKKQYPSDSNSENTEKFSDYSINKFVVTTDFVFSTFAIDVDTASYTVMRGKIKEKQLPPPSSVRIEEYINYFDYNYPSPSTGLFTVHSQIADNPFNNGETKLLRVALRAKDISNAERKTAHLTFLIDVSGSMDSDRKLPLVKETLKMLIENLRNDDTIAICTYASRSEKVLEPTPIAEKEKILLVLDSLRAGGSTYGEDGLKNAYEMADSSYNPRHINRIVLCTDGDFNVGEIEGKSLAEAVNRYARKGITISAVGYGFGNYKDDKLEKIANASNGNYFYIDSIDEVKKVFGTDLVSTLDVVAADVKIQLEFNPNFINQYRLVGYETRALTTEQFRDDIVDAGEIGAGHSVTAIYELVMENPLDNMLQVPKDLDGFAAIFRIRYKEFITDEKANEVNFKIENKISRFDNAEPSLKFAAGVMGFADILRNSPYAKGWKIITAVECCETGAINSEEKTMELIGLMRKAISMRDK